MNRATPYSTSNDPDMLALNRDCFCFPMVRDDIIATISSTSQTFGMQSMLEERPHYFASTGVFLSQGTIDAMMAQIAAIEATAKLPAYQQALSARDGDVIYAAQPGPAGAFMGYDFHITADGPRLIEVNSNAGGAFIVNALERSIGKPTGKTEAKLHAMFLEEWRLAGRSSVPETLVIVDDDPTRQYHYPDMCLARALLEKQGLAVFIADPDELVFDNGRLLFGDIPVDIVYNRLTDFGLAEQKNAALRQALLADAAVVTPAPRHHASLADKRNLTLLSDGDLMDNWGVSPAHHAQLSRIPQTIAVTPDNADRLWADRKQYFFKPNAGFGSRAAYRGAKLTKKTWVQILAGGYVAQEFISAPVRAVLHDDQQAALKFDVRIYTYRGEMLGLAARVYRGQTTNLRTAGGGLAPVLSMQDCSLACRTA